MPLGTPSGLRHSPSSLRPVYVPASPGRDFGQGSLCFAGLSNVCPQNSAWCLASIYSVNRMVAQGRSPLHRTLLWGHRCQRGSWRPRGQHKVPAFTDTCTAVRDDTPETNASAPGSPSASLLPTTGSPLTEHPRAQHSTWLTAGARPTHVDRNELSSGDGHLGHRDPEVLICHQMGLGGPGDFSPRARTPGW